MSDWDEKTDWDKIAADECLHNCDEGTPLRRLMEEALRKAKADGYRQGFVETAEKLSTVFLKVMSGEDGREQAQISNELADELLARASAIEKGTE